MPKTHTHRPFVKLFHPNGLHGGDVGDGRRVGQGKPGGNEKALRILPLQPKNKNSQYKSETGGGGGRKTAEKEKKMTIGYSTGETATRAEHYFWVTRSEGCCTAERQHEQQKLEESTPLARSLALSGNAPYQTEGKAISRPAHHTATPVPRNPTFCRYIFYH